MASLGDLAGNLGDVFSTGIVDYATNVVDHFNDPAQQYASSPGGPVVHNPTQTTAAPATSKTMLYGGIAVAIVIVVVLMARR